MPSLARHRRIVRRPNPPIDLKELVDLDAEQIKVLSRYAKRGKEHAAIMRRVRPILARNGYTLGEELGSGSAATAFALADFPEYVAKLTYDPTDAAIMSEFSTLPDPPPPGLPEVITVAYLGDGLYLIVMERLEPLSSGQQRSIDALARKLSFGYEIMAYPNLWKAWKDKPAAPQHAYLNALRFVHALGYNAYDIGEDNVMRRPSDKSVVVSDFGFSSPRRGETVRQDVPRLRNPRDRLPRHMRTTRKNPVIDLSKFPVQESVVDSQFPIWQQKADAPMVRDAHARAVLARNGIQTTPESIGEGSFAAVYPMRDDPNVVVKITNDPTDAAVMAEMAFVPIQPGVPKVYGVYDLGEAPDARAGGNIYAILIERLFPLTDQQHHAIKYLSVDVERGWYSEEVDDLWEDFKESPASVGYAYLNAVRILRALGFRPSDLHASNLMRRLDGSFAVSDFGLSLWDRFRPPASRDIRRLQNPRRRR